jgi:hypothetical protein
MTNSAFWDTHAPMLVAAVLALTTIVCAPPPILRANWRVLCPNLDLCGEL